MADAPAIYRLLAACGSAVLGEPDVTEEDVRAELVEPGFDPLTDAWLVDDAGGELVGYGWACPKGDSDNLDVDAYVRPGADNGLGPMLLAAAEERAVVLGAERGHRSVVIDKGVYRQDAASAAWVRDRGYAVATTFHRMRIDLTGPVSVPQPPAGVAVRLAADEADRRAAHMVKNMGFADHFGSISDTFEEWWVRLTTSAGHDPTQLWLAEVGGVAVGMCRASDQFVTDQQAGYVGALATLPAYRGRGIARLLLLTAFTDAARRGRRAVLLHVDAANTSGALRLYESVGMRPVMQLDVWRKRIPTGGATRLATDAARGVASAR